MRRATEMHSECVDIYLRQHIIQNSLPDPLLMIYDVSYVIDYYAITFSISARSLGTSVIFS